MHYDIANTQTTITALSANIAQIAPYANAMANLPLGSQPIIVDMATVAHWNPLSQCPPELESALEIVQQHCADFQGTLLFGLHDFPMILAEVEPTITSNLATVAGVLKALQDPAETPTETQRQMVETALQEVQQKVSGLSQMLAELQRPTQQFIPTLSADHKTLFLGSLSLSDAIANINETFESDAKQYVGQPMGDAIINIMGGITKQMTDALQAVLDSVDSALQAGQQTDQALESFLEIFATLSTGFSSVVGAVQSAEDDQLVPVLQQLDVQNAQSYWKQLSAFAQKTGFET